MIILKRMAILYRESTLSRLICLPSQVMNIPPMYVLTLPCEQILFPLRVGHYEKEKGFCIHSDKRKEFTSKSAKWSIKGSKFFPFRTHPFQNWEQFSFLRRSLFRQGMVCRKASKKSQKVVFL